MTAEPKQAKTETSPTSIAISLNPISGYGFTPQDSTVPNLGTVQFAVAPACWVWTFVAGALANVFAGEQLDHVLCNAGTTNYTVLSQYSNTLITIVGTAINAAPPHPPESPISDTLKGTIKVGS
jgi:hypothetical protein